MAGTVCASLKANVAVNNVRDWPAYSGSNGEVHQEKLTSKWQGLPPGLSSVALYSRSAKLKMPFRSIAEELARLECS